MTDIPSFIPALFRTIPALAAACRNHEAYLVGGAVRDILTGNIPIDYDIVVQKDPQSLADAISRETGAFFFKLGKDRQAVFRGQTGGITLDLVCMAGGSIESDLRLRDFTINAMAVHVGSGLFLDPLNGRRDLAARTLRTVSKKAFPGDPLRLLRAYRLAATLNFEIDIKTESAIKTYSRLIRLPAGERIREELFRLLGAPFASGHLEKMKETGLLFELFPELADEQACTQNRHHRFDVLEHSLLACRHLEYFLNGNGLAGNPSLRIAIDGIDGRRKPVLKLAMLLHDIGKPGTRTLDAAGTVHFHGHEKTGAEMAKAVAGRLKLSTADSLDLRELVENHLRPALLYQAHRSRSLTRKGIVRLFMSANDRTPLLLLMALADACAKTETTGEMDPSFPGFIADLSTVYYRDYLPRKQKAPLITGQDLITLFGLNPSPLFKTILAAVEEARLSQRIHGREDALARVRTWLATTVKSDLPEPKKD